jgi:hypothetical protein
MNILAIDPGTTETAYVVLVDDEIAEFEKDENEEVRQRVAQLLDKKLVDHVVIEMVKSYGMRVGADIFETCVYIGELKRTAEDRGATVHRMGRKEVVLEVCRSPRASDGDVIQAMKDRWGEPGTKKTPGATYGIKDDIWQALGLATAFKDIKSRETDLAAAKGHAKVLFPDDEIPF